MAQFLTSKKMNDFGNSSFFGNGSAGSPHPVMSNTSVHYGATSAMKEESPLKIFGLAKKKIGEIFDEIYEYLLESKEFLDQDGQVQQQCVSSEQRDEVTEFIVRAHNIREILARNQMKVAFFGRTSNGKSTVINSVLHKNILPYGMGHTTNCFLQIEGIDGNEPYYLLNDDPNNRLSIENINLLANALDSENLGDDTLCKIYWPKHKCRLLRDEVVLVDSPGIDVSPNLDSWIDKYCLDADVFVLVSNSESTIMQAEKSFFHKVSQKISKPNIFILQNRWDVVSMEPESAKVKKQHTERGIDFLAEELKVVSRDEAHERVFFVSAKEVINTRLQGKDALLNGSMREGHQQRYFEFEDFERKFEECLSKSAIKTKFDQHTRCGQDITGELIRILDANYSAALELRDQKQLERQDKQEKLTFINQQLEYFTREIKFLITSIVEKVENKVSLALNEEIKRLSLLIKDFEQPFSDEKLALDMYKSRLHGYIESGLDANLKARLNTTLKICVDNAREAMVDRVFTILPREIDINRDEFVANANFTVYYQLNCKSLCSDFQEDLEFRFSFSLANILNHLNLGLFKGSKRPGAAEQLSSDASNSVATLAYVGKDENNELVRTIEKYMFFVPSSQTTAVSLAVGGSLVKLVGIRVLIGAVTFYVAIYGYQRLTWTNAKKEKIFKKQYARHATQKLKLIVDLTSANCSHQIKQELMTICSRLGSICDKVIRNLERDVATLNTEIQELEERLVNSRKLKNRALYLRLELENFWEKYLNQDS